MPTYHACSSCQVDIAFSMFCLEPDRVQKLLYHPWPAVNTLLVCLCQLSRLSSASKRSSQQTCVRWVLAR